MATDVETMKSLEMKEKLRRREEDRLQGVLERKTAKRETIVAQETPDFFRREFDQIQSAIEAALKASSAPSSSSEKAKYFDDLSISVDQLQRLLTDSIQFLSPFSIEKSQDVVNQLKTSVETARNEVLPRKKFAFKSEKKKLTKAIDAVDAGDNPRTGGDGPPRPTKAKASCIDAEADVCGFSGLKDQVLCKSREEVTGRDVTLSSLVNCTVRLTGSPTAFHANDLVNCRIFSGPISGSAFVDGCRGCIFVVGCQQLRVHTTTETEFYLHVTSRAIVEDCNAVTFAPFNWTYDGIDADYKDSGLDRARNNWNDVDDFNWLSADVPSPNWSLIDEEKRVRSW